MEFFRTCLLTSIAGIVSVPNISSCLAAVEIPDFHLNSIGARKSSYVFCTADEVTAARKRISQQEYGQILESLNSEADKAQDINLTAIDGQWWQAVKDKSWSETYPIIYQKTCLDPLQLVRPAYFAALRYLIYERADDLVVAKRILLHLSDYSFEFEHYDVGMNYAVWGYLALYSFDICCKQLSEDERAKLDAFFTRMARAVMKNDAYWIEHNVGGGINNHLAWHKMILGCLGIFYGYDQLVDYALRGPRGLISLLEDGLIDDGLWCESSLTYHFTAIVPMVYLAEALRHSQYSVDLYKLTTPKGRSLRQAYDAMFGVLFPDATVPPIGDAYGRRMKLWEEFTYWYVSKAYGDPRYAWLLAKAERKRPELLFMEADIARHQVPAVSSRVYPEHGYAFLRNRQDAEYWDSDGWCAFVTFDKSGVHCNQDKLSLMLFGYGKLLLADVEAKATVPHAFSSRVQRELNRCGLSQNTVMINYHDQRGIDQLLSVIEYSDTPEEKRIAVADDKGLLYEGVRQSRTILVRDEYVLDVFQIVGSTQQDIAWIIHTIGNPASQKCSVQLSPKKIEIPGPGSWLRDFQVGTSDGEIHMNWSEEGVHFGMTMAADSGTKVMTCGYPWSDEPDCRTSPMILIERHKASTIYAAVYQAGRKTLSQISVTRLDDMDGQLVYRVDGPWGKHRHVIQQLR